MKHLLLSAVAALAVTNSEGAHAAEITLIAPGGIRAAVMQMIPAFERQTGHTVKATFGSGGGTKQRVIKGEAFDVPIVQPPLEPVTASGQVVLDSETPLAIVQVGVAVRTGAPKPDISTADAVKRLLLGAKAISYPNAASGAAAGLSFNETLQKLGIAEADEAQDQDRPGRQGRHGDARQGRRRYRLDLHQRNHHRAGRRSRRGPLPRDISTPTGLVGFVSAQAKDPAAAKALVSYLSGPEAAAVYKERGMVPGR